MVALPQSNSSTAREPRLLDRVRDALRLRHYSYRTEQGYLQWVRRFIFFHQKRHPRDVATTMIYTHVLNRGGQGVVSPLDRYSSACTSPAPAGFA